MPKKTKPAAASAPTSEVDITQDASLGEQGFGALPFVAHNVAGSWISKAQVEACVELLKSKGFDTKVISLREYCTDDAIVDEMKPLVLETFDSTGEATDWQPHVHGLAAGGWKLVAVLGDDPNAVQMDAVAILAHAAEPPSTAGRAADFLIGNLMQACKGRFMGLAVPWSQLSETEQTNTLRNLADDVRQAVGQAIKAIASNERLTFRAEVESVQFKGASDIKAVLKLMAGAESHALADSAGGFVTVVIEDVNDLLALPDAAMKGEPDQKTLFDQNTSGTALDTKREAVPA